MENSPASPASPSTTTRILATLGTAFTAAEWAAVPSAARRVFCATDNARCWCHAGEREMRPGWKFTCHRDSHVGPVVHTVVVQAEDPRYPVAYNVARGLAKVVAVQCGCTVINEAA